MALITDLPATTTLSNSNVFVVDTGTTTNKITAANAGAELFRIGAPIEVSENTVNAGESITITFGTYTHALIVTAGYVSTAQNLYIASSAATALQLATFGTSSTMTATVNGLNLTIANSGTYNAYVDLIVFRGSITVS